MASAWVSGALLTVSRRLPFSGGGSKLPSLQANVKTPENARKRWVLSGFHKCGVDPFQGAWLSS